MQGIRILGRRWFRIDVSIARDPVGRTMPITLNGSELDITVELAAP